MTQMEVENKQMQAATEEVFLQSKNRQYIEHTHMFIINKLSERKCCEGFLRKLLQEKDLMTGARTWNYKL